MGLLCSFSTALVPSFAFSLTTLVPSQKHPSNNPHSSQKDPLGGCAATRVWFTRRVWVVFWESHKAKKLYKTLAQRVHLLGASALWDAACPQHPHVAWGSPGHFGQLEGSASQRFIFLTPLHFEHSLPNPMVLACSRCNPAHTCSFTGITPKSLRGCGIYSAQLVFNQQQDKLPGVWQDHTTWHGLLQIRRRWKATVRNLGWKMENGNMSEGKSRPQDKTPEGLQRGWHLYQVGYGKLRVRDFGLKSAVFCRICC